MDCKDVLEISDTTRKMAFWIQRADFSADEFDPVDLDSARSILRNHDWRAELRLEGAREAKGKDWCMPGIGFVEDVGHILHICPRDNGIAHCFYLCGEIDPCEATDAWIFLQNRLLQLFFQGDYEGVTRAMLGAQ